MQDDFWKDKYPADIEREITIGHYQSILDVIEESCVKYAHKPMFSNMEKTLSYAEVYELSGHFAAYLQNHSDLEVGDRIAIQLPNILQYPIAVLGAMRAGLVVVNTNPLYTTREMEHQFNDSGAKAIVVLANMAASVEAVIEKTSIEHVIVTELGDMLGFAKGLLVNCVVKHVKKMVPAYHLPGAISFKTTLSVGADEPLGCYRAKREDIAILQYTGGTTGIAQGAMLTHGNLLANMCQARSIMGSDFVEGGELAVAPLPLYHIYAFTFHCLVMTVIGAENLLITNPRDIPTFVKTLKDKPFTIMVGLNTLFVGLMKNSAFKSLDFSKLSLTCSGGMALQQATEAKWEKITGCEINEGYGMTETSPIATVNPKGRNQVGSIGIPVPSTEIVLRDDEGLDVAQGELGEICIRGPQVMKGYWQRPKATAAILSEDGWLHSGDIGCIQEDGYIKIVDRKKDMIIVSGFNVYPNELEDVLAEHEDIVQCAAIGIPHESAGEQIKIFVVSDNPYLSKEDIISYLKNRVTSYKVPKLVEFRAELPVTNVGKILRRELRDHELLMLKEMDATT